MFGDVIGLLIGATGHMLQLQPPELLLHLADFRKVGFHVLILWLIHLVGDIDKELRIALDGEAFHPQGSCGLQARYYTFILRYVVADLFTLLETELYSVVELVLSGRYKHRPSPGAMSGERPIEVHDPAFWRLASRGEGPILVGLEAWCIRPFCHKIR